MTRRARDRDIETQPPASAPPRAEQAFTASHTDTDGAALLDRITPALGPRVGAVRAIGCALAADTERAWLDLAVILAARLTRRERVALAFAVWRTLVLADRKRVAEAVREAERDGGPDGT